MHKAGDCAGMSYIVIKEKNVDDLPKRGNTRTMIKEIKTILKLSKILHRQCDEDRNCLLKRI